ncbi:hypothetical protein SCMU_18260 [Sinomonas cyclohexanicum]|uniref:Uncharacterized protein n=1 Tax=Sinomonas cyclohexanicum TaxID=322009 RepID=A0ABM7PUQ7_SINCY|nr:hypothetical protein [Corynebacterium cyclohexanicum]BCT75984.1 hypothetical protein SCMU_18260 [Corynebacterium cyclohexanicum]
MDQSAPLIDPRRCWKMSARYRIAECVTPCGETEYWILDSVHPDQVTVETPDHEQLGRLPARYAAALGLTCGATTRHGRPCRNPVHAHGDRCPHHTHAAFQEALPLPTETRTTAEAGA